MEEEQKKEKGGDISKEEIPEEIKELVIARLDLLSEEKKISVGSSGEFTKNELIEHIKEDDEIGRKMVEIELELLKAQREGSLLKEILSSESEQNQNE